MKNYLWFAILFIVAWSPKPVTSHDKQINTPPILMGVNQSSKIECTVFCNPEKPGTGSVRLKWDASTFREADYRIDATIFKSGFKKNMFSTLWPLNRSESFKTLPAAKLPERSDKELFYLKNTSINFNARDKTVIAEFEGLRPGVNYYFRLMLHEQNNWNPSGTIMCEGPVCVKD